MSRIAPISGSMGVRSRKGKPSLILRSVPPDSRKSSLQNSRVVLKSMLAPPLRAPIMTASAISDVCLPRWIEGSFILKFLIVPAMLFYMVIQKMPEFFQGHRPVADPVLYLFSKHPETVLITLRDKEGVVTES